MTTISRDEALGALRALAESNPSAFDKLLSKVKEGVDQLQQSDFPLAFEQLACAVESEAAQRCLNQLWETIFAVLLAATAHHACGHATGLGRRAVQHYLATNAPRVILRKAYTALAVGHVEGNEPLEAISALLEQQRLAQEVGDTLGEVGASINIGAALMQLGMYAETIAISNDLLARLGDQLVETESTPYRSTLYVNIAQSELARQRCPEALRAARQALDIFPQPKTVEGRTRLLQRLGVVARALAGCGRHAEAMDVLQEARRHEATSLRAAQGLLETEATLLAFAAKPAEAILLLRRGLDQFRDGGRTTELRIHLARFLELAGRFDEARALYGQLASQTRAHKLQRTLDDLHASAPAVVPSTAHAAFGDLRAQVEARAAILSHFEVSTTALQRLADIALLQVDPSGCRAHRVGKLAALIFIETGASIEDCLWIEAAAKLLDVGYAELPREILTKPAGLTPAEVDLVRSHPASGAIMIGADTPPLARAADLVRAHHEQWDGSGYPQGLAAEAIPFEARVATLADVFDALTHQRPWRKAYGTQQSLQIIEDRAVTHFDPKLVAILSRTVVRLEREHGNLEAFLSSGARASPALTLRSRLLASLTVDSAVEAGRTETTAPT